MVKDSYSTEEGTIKRAFHKALLICIGVLTNALGQAGADSQKKVGGQAVIEGVMMRGQDLWSVMVRKPQGTIVGQTKQHKAWTERKPWKFPFIRGLAVLFESLILGIKALNYSTEISILSHSSTSMEEDKTFHTSEKTEAKTKVETTYQDQVSDIDSLSKDPNSKDNQIKPHTDKHSQGVHPFYIVFSITFGIGLGLLLFVVLPHVLSVWVGWLGGFDDSTLFFHVIDGILKFAIFLAYVWLIGFIPDIGRVFAYHGAEHQAIHVYEAGLPFEPCQAKTFPTWHRRCGTAFIFLVLSASILFFACLFPLIAPLSGLSTLPRTLAGVGLKILFTPLLAALAYEVTRLASKPNAGPIWRTLVWPGLLLQRLTTRKPDDSMLEVAFKSLEAVIPEHTERSTFVE